MHQHPCKRCNKTFVCGESFDECFAAYIVCDDCYRNIDLKYLIGLLVMGSAIIFLIHFAWGKYF